MARIKVELAPRPRLLMTAPGDSIGGQVIAYTHPGDPHAVIEVPDDWDAAQVEQWAQGLLKAGLLTTDGELWRPEKTLTTLGIVVPEDVGALWQAGDTFLGLGVTPETQARGNWGRGVKVALLDTGLDGTHPWFATMRGEGRLDGDLSDSHGHGTHCGGTITGQYGIAPGANLRVWNVLPGGSGSESGIAAGIDAAVAWGAQVISMSLGGAGSSAIINGAVQRARQAGVLVSSAAGNGSSAGPVGSPAMVSSFVVMAYDRSDPARWAPFTDGKYPSDASLPRVARPGVEVVSAKPGGGTQPMSGTSMACPHNTGVAALLLGAGMSGAAVEQYTASHMGAAPEGKTSKLLADFGEGEGQPPPPPTDDLDQARAELAKVIALQDDARYINRDADPDFAWTEIGEASRIAAIVRDRLGKAPEPPPPPQWPDPRTYLKGWSAAAHWAGSREGRYAVDWYAAPLGTPFGWIEGGRTRGYGMVGPLFLPEGGHDCCLADPSVYRPTASGRLEVEWGPDDWRAVPDGHVFLPANSTLWTLVLDIDGGQEMVSFTHVLKEAKLGVHVAKYEPFVKEGDSGLEPFTARGQHPEHTHFAAMIGGQQYGVWQGGMGNTPAWEYLLSKGFQIRQKPTVPSPQDYINGYVNREPY